MALDSTAGRYGGGGGALYMYFAAFVIVLSSIQFGYHNGELNTPKSVIAGCSSPDEEQGFIFLSLPRCIQMSDSQYSLVTAVFTLGGMVGSAFGGRLADTLGRRGTLAWANGPYILGSLFMAFSVNISMLMVGRFLVGVSSGVSIVAVPTYLAEISPPDVRGITGILNQLGIVFGILSAQTMGYLYSTVSGWRWILLSIVGVSIVQLLAIQLCVESPRFMASQRGRLLEARKALQRLRGIKDVDAELSQYDVPVDLEVLPDSPNGNADSAGLDESQQPILDGSGAASSPAWAQSVPSAPLSGLWRLLTAPVYRQRLFIVVVLYIGQQLSGVNVVVYFSTPILEEVMPGYAGLLTLVISLMNMAVSLVAARFSDTSGRRPLLLLSSSTMAVATFVLAFSLEFHWTVLAAISIISVVSTFAIGLGPITFLVPAEIFDVQMVATAVSLGTAIHWIVNFLVTSVFLTLHNALGGFVFLIFAGILVTHTALMYRWVPETKGQSLEEIARMWE